MNTKNTNRLVVATGFLAAFLVFYIFVANAAHFSGDKIQKDPESWFNSAYRCKAEALVPVTSKTKGETVKELQNCLRFLHESYVPMDGKWDRETRKSVKWFYKHFLGKKSNGKKFDQAAVERMRELAALAEPFLPVEEASETSVVEDTSEVASEDADLRAEVERLIAESANWQSYMRKRAKEEAGFDLPDDWRELGKKSGEGGLGGFENFYYGAFKYIERAKQELENGNVEKAYQFAKPAEESRLNFDSDFAVLKEAIELERQRAVEEEGYKRAAEEDRKQMEEYQRKVAQKLAELKKKLKPVCTDLDCMIAAGLECATRSMVFSTYEGGGKGGAAAEVQTRLALKGKKGDTCNLFIKIEKVEILPSIDHLEAREYRSLLGKEGLCPLNMNMWWEMNVENDVSHTFIEIKKEMEEASAQSLGFSIRDFMHGFKINHQECTGTYFDSLVY